MNYIIKRLSGLIDAHTKYEKIELIPLNFRIFDNEILINYPEEIKGFKLNSINNIPVNIIIEEIEDVITYGTIGKRKYEIEKSLFNKYIMFSLPSLRESNQLSYEIIDNKGNSIIKIFNKEESYDDTFDYSEYSYGKPATYYLKDNCLIYNHSSVQDSYKNIIEESINNLRKEDLSNINTIIIDIRGNAGGNSNLNKILMDFIKEHTDKKLICLTDYRVFSGGRYALRDLIELSAITIGEEISTPINCFGNSNWFNIDNHYFTVSECYFDPFKRIDIDKKEDYDKLSNLDKKTYNFKPDILINQTKEDYINGVDTILNYAINYSKIGKIENN